MSPFQTDETVFFQNRRTGAPAQGSAKGQKPNGDIVLEAEGFEVVLPLSDCYKNPADVSATV